MRGPGSYVHLVTRSSMPGIDEYMDEIKPIFESHWMTNMGHI